jgi:hypothetical protein
VSWRSEWNALSGRIAGIGEAGGIYIQIAQVNAGDPARVAEKLLIPQAAAIAQEMKDFRALHGSRLPPTALTCLDRNIESAGKYTTGSDYWGVQAALTFLAVFRAEFEQTISDHSAVARNLTERAFSHLQRSLIADTDLLDRWKAAFGKREDHCEKLGAVHLLSHGIWAFKAHATDATGRTDLVLGTLMQSTTEAERAAEALVLTEWKMVKDKEDPNVKADEAMKQARLYAGGAGILGGFELSDTRYLVLVSKKACGPVEDRQDNEVTYRVIQIMLEPVVPSAAARRKGKK